MDTTTEDGESFISNTDAIINGTSDISALAESLISGPNIPNSSWTSADDVQQQISTAGGGGAAAADDMMIVSSGASSMLSNTNKQSEIMIFNVDFRAVAVCNNSDKIEEKGSAESSKRLECRFGLGSNIGGAVNEETSFRFVNIYTLMACAEAIQQNNLNLADALVSDIKRLAVQQSGAVKKVVYYFDDTLDRTINGMNAPYIVESSYCTDELLQMYFYETSPYLKFAHFTANQAILEAFADSNRVHVIDFSLNQGSQWPVLMQALALRHGAPPAFRLTGIGLPQHSFLEVRYMLVQLAEKIGLEFEFRGFLANSLTDVDAMILSIRSSNVEAVAVNSIFEPHHAMSRPGAIEKLLNTIKEMQPKIVTTIIKQEATNSEWTQSYSRDSEMAEQYPGRQIHNAVTCKGSDRIERHDTLSQWRVKMNSVGFNSVRLNSNTCNQASKLLSLFHNRHGCGVEENDGFLMLSRDSQPLIATSAWQLTPPTLG